MMSKPGHRQHVDARVGHGSVNALSRYVDDDSALAAGATLRRLHATLRIEHGTFEDEYPEQLMSARFVPPDAHVLEIGGNIGRNSCVIASLLADSANLVVLESDPECARVLERNRDLNGLRFAVEPVAVSRRRLVQRGWDTWPVGPDDPVPPGWAEVPTTTLAELRAKHPTLAFDTLVLDCEGAAYFILLDEPTFLDGVRLVLIENDFFDAAHKGFFDAALVERGFVRVHSEPLDPAKVLPRHVCADCFFEAWLKP